MLTHLDKDGTTRPDYYGTGRQPWDDAVDFGWAVHFAAANILKYLRRSKNQEHSESSARWYWSRLKELANGCKGNEPLPDFLAMLYKPQAVEAFRQLRVVLSERELSILEENKHEV